VRSLPPVLEVILRPDRRRPDPPTLVVDMRRVFLVGLLLWTVALVVCLVLWLTGATGTTPVWTCVAGLAVGLVGLVWERLGGGRS
jgi:Protein of unknown function (DUF2530)